ncbi:hypothetical protein N6H14_28710 [Paenibacillus sp. CC-CFT747]|nr:hypothetical protein N6H14_28710 [Paenibacillus sp. CC-CFT747]
MKRNAGFLLVFLSALLLGACSLLDKANQTLDYANQATGHLTRLSDFAQEAPSKSKRRPRIRTPRRSWRTGSTA